MGYTHLHVHTEYSILKSSVRIDELVKKAAEYGMESLAITDFSVMYGILPFYKACQRYHIKPVIGCEVSTGGGTLVLLAKDEEGYSNLKRIVSLSFIKTFSDNKAKVTFESLKEHHAGLIAIEPFGGNLARLILAGEKEKATEYVNMYAGLFGRENFYLEISDYGGYEDKALIKQFLRLSRELEVRVVALNEVFYLEKSDAIGVNVLKCIDEHKKFEQKDMAVEACEHWFKSQADMSELFGYAQAAVAASSEIAARCNVKIEFGRPRLPKFTLDEGVDSFEYLTSLCKKGLKERYKSVTKEISTRLEYELSVIRKMGFVDYFLIVWDFVKYARDRGILVGDGRGSAAGSIVSYALHITNVDPLAYGLIFERFLNPERVTMPDIDIDFAHNRRNEVVRYVIDKYGEDNVVQIVAFGTLAARAVIRDVVRVLGLGYDLGDEICRYLVDGSDKSLRSYLEEVDELQVRYETDPSVKMLLDISMQLEGLIRHTTIHPAGVVICNEPAMDVFPLALSSDGNVVLQCEKKEAEELGLLKIDFLSLRNLTVIDDTVRFIRENGNEIDMDALDYKDPAVYSMISAGDTDGVFQLESRGMKMFMRRLKPTSFDQIVAGLALFRPGPMDFIPTYIERCNGAKTEYLHPKLKPILEDTYGCIVYQEQVMRIFRDFAGYSMGRSDKVRKIMAEKNVEVMKAERKNFIYGNGEYNIKGCVASGIDAGTAGELFDMMLDFASYAFNKSHAVAYSVIAYKTAYLKYHYPVEFMAALLSSVIGNIDKVSAYISNFRKHGGVVLPPSVNEPSVTFFATPSGVRFGLAGIKGVGDGVAESIIAEYKQREYTGFTDFLDRNISKGLNKKNVENLIKSGALDSLGLNRKQMIHNYERIMDDLTVRKKHEITGQLNLFDFGDEKSLGGSEYTIAKVAEFSSDELLNMESEVLGIYVSAHPLDDFLTLIEKNVTHYSSDINNDDFVDSISERERLIVGGFVSAVSIRQTKKGESMALLTLEDYYGSMDVVVFPKQYKKFGALLKPGKKLFIVGNIRRDERRKSVSAFDVIPFDAMPKVLKLGFDDEEAFKRLSPEISGHIYRNGGRVRVVAFLIKENAKKVMARNMDIKSADIEAIKGVLGNDRVIFADDVISKSY